jgi:UDP-2-acetamido-3-amino-2,3-dideoxy-glucuronate N-acetyltransferase
MTSRIHETAIVEAGVAVGAGTSIWDNVHIRGPGTIIGDSCIIGGKTYVASGVTIGSRVKLNANVYVCSAVTIEDGVMVAAGVIFTNDVYPRAATPDLAALRPSEPDHATRPTIVRQGATIGAGCIIGCDLEVGRFAMVGMGAVVTRSVPDFALAIGHPARVVGFVDRAGRLIVRFDAPPSTLNYVCADGYSYEIVDGRVVDCLAART